MIEFFQQFNESFYGVIDYIALLFPFCLFLTMLIVPIIFFIECFKRK